MSAVLWDEVFLLTRQIRGTRRGRDGTGTGTGTDSDPRSPSPGMMFSLPG